MHEATHGHLDSTELGVMGNPNGAVRDPLFFRWHKVFNILTVYPLKKRISAKARRCVRVFVGFLTTARSNRLKF